MGFRQKIKAKAMRVVEKQLEKKAQKEIEKVAGEGTEIQKAANLAVELQKMIPIVGKKEMKRRVVAGVSEEWREAKQKNPQVTVEELVGQYLKDPRILGLYLALDMSEEDVRNLAQEVIDNEYP